MTEETIRKEFIKGYDCSQVVLRAFADKLGLTEDEANRVAACFCLPRCLPARWQRALAAE